MWVRSKIRMTQLQNVDKIFLILGAKYFVIAPLPLSTLRTTICHLLTKVAKLRILITFAIGTVLRVRVLDTYINKIVESQIVKAKVFQCVNWTAKI